MWMLIRKNKKNHTQVYLYEDGFARIAAHKYAAAKKVKRDNKKEDT